MKRLWLFALLGIVGSLGTPSAHAGPIWSLDWQFGTNVDVSNTGRSLIHFTPNNTTSTALNGTPIIAKITETSSVSAAHPDPITHQNYGFYLKLTDLASHASRSLWFSGTLSGSLSKTTSSLTNHFHAPTTYTFVLGKDKYTVYARTNNPSQCEQPFPWKHGGPCHRPADSAGVNATPEPATWSLAAAGLVLTGFGTWRGRRRAAP